MNRGMKEEEEGRKRHQKIKIMISASHLPSSSLATNFPSLFNSRELHASFLLSTSDDADDDEKFLYFLLFKIK